MRIVLRTDIDKVGKRGDIVDVADGYARNYLLPKGHAIVATNGVTAQATPCAGPGTSRTPRTASRPRSSPGRWCRW